jgi:ferredoxin
VVRVYVDGVEVDVPEGSTVLEAASRAGRRVPTLCYLGGVFSEATCRVCVVKAGGRVVPACAYPVSEGLKVVTEDEELARLRRVSLELVLASHRISCWSCFSKSSCRLLNVARELGVEGIPVCAECPLYGPSCLVARGEPCLGALTVAGCGALCPRSGTPCIGCRGYVSSERVWREAVDGLYRRYLKSLEDLRAAAGFFWTHLPPNLRRYLGDGP